ncbi:MAG: adenylyl-sulfate kinase [Thermoplasmata archaeon]|nr:MAG: adenylyl-sulfate kinase [Thermoplasmata archaeon]
MKEQKATNVTWHKHKVEKKDRETLLKQKGVILWFTGLSGSGKSTIANEVAYQLHKKGNFSYVLDGDNIRYGLNKDLGFNPEDRDENIRRISEVAHLFSEAGIIAITAFISPYQTLRDFCRNLQEKERFFEIYCKASIGTCEKRDPKGLYKKARAGEIKEFTGIDAPYEKPENPEIILDTDRYNVEQCAEQVIKKLQKTHIIQ